MDSEWQHASFGDKEAWKYFEREHQVFLQRFGNLKNAIEFVAQSRINLHADADKVLYFLCQQCTEDYNEILLLSGNGYGIGAQRILRTMYEHAVTMLYLASHPTEAASFLDYSWIQEQKLVRSIQEIFGDGLIPEQNVSEIRSQYEGVRHQFMITDCKKCGTMRINHTWNKLDFVSMAREAGDIGKLIVHSYFLPLLQSHPSVRSINSRLVRSEGNELVFNFAGQHKEAALALSTANALLISVFECFGNYFQIPELLEKVSVCTKDHEAAWAAPKQ